MVQVTSMRTCLRACLSGGKPYSPWYKAKPRHVEHHLFAKLPQGKVHSGSTQLGPRFSQAGEAQGAQECGWRPGERVAVEIAAGQGASQGWQGGAYVSGMSGGGAVHARDTKQNGEGPMGEVRPLVQQMRSVQFQPEAGRPLTGC